MYEFFNVCIKSFPLHRNKIQLRIPLLLLSLFLFKQDNPIPPTISYKKSIFLPLFVPLLLYIFGEYNFNPKYNTFGITVIKITSFSRA